MDAAAQVNCAVQHGYQVEEHGSHTLQRRDFGDIEARRAALIAATVEAIADGSGPRLQRSRLCP